MRLIDADKLKAYLQEEYVMYDHTLTDIDKQPTVDAEPIRYGHWVDVNGDGSLWRCSVCREAQCCKSNYCGDCGAKMDEDWEEPEINPCRGCTDYDGQGGCKSNGGCGAERRDNETY